MEIPTGQQTFRPFIPDALTVEAPQVDQFLWSVPSVQFCGCFELKFLCFIKFLLFYFMVFVCQSNGLIRLFWFMVLLEIVLIYCTI